MLAWLKRTMDHRLARTLAWTFLASLSASRAEASISGSRASVADDAASLQASAQEDRGPSDCTVFTLETDSGVVREYLSASGVVFAVTWSGLVHPDLGTVLGPHARAWRAAVRSSPPARGRRGHRVATEHVVVETWGHMRHLQGRAHAPALVPAGVVIDDLP